jgi:hypothetical protein
MAWQFYAILVVLCVWLMNYLYHLGSQRIESLKQYYRENKIPIIFEDGLIDGKLIFFKCTNVTDLKITSFKYEIEIKDVNGKILFLKENYLFTNNLSSYMSKDIKLHVSLSDGDEVLSINPIKTTFSNETTWKI